MKRKKVEDDLAAKVLRAVKARELGKRNYKRCDQLMEQLAKEIEPGQVIKVSADRGFKLVDNYAGKAIVWTPCAARKWELEEVPV